MTAELHTVQPDTSLVESGTEMQFHMPRVSRPGPLELAEIPGDAVVIVETADIPGVWDVDPFRARRNRGLPSESAAATIGVGAKLPIPVEVNPGRGENRHREQQHPTCSEHPRQIT